MKCAVLIEKTSENCSAYVPDLPRCVATGKTPESITQLIQDAIAFHLEGMRKGGLLVPDPQASTVLVEV